MKNKRRSFAPGTLLSPLPPAMVTVGDFENANILTIAWTGILASQPPKTYISVRPSRHSYGILKEKGEFDKLYREYSAKYKIVKKEA